MGESSDTHVIRRVHNEPDTCCETFSSSSRRAVLIEYPQGVVKPRRRGDGLAQHNDLLIFGIFIPIFMV